jgi:hypothetical protein
MAYNAMHCAGKDANKDRFRLKEIITVRLKEHDSAYLNNSHRQDAMTQRFDLG